jgi:hypothetical protein
MFTIAMVGRWICSSSSAAYRTDNRGAGRQRVLSGVSPQTNGHLRFIDLGDYWT